MPTVNWDQPSTGLVSDANPSLLLRNGTGGALLARSRQTAVEADSKNGLALHAYTNTTMAARIDSATSIGALLLAPKSVAALAGNQSGNAAVAGVSATDPAVPNPVLNPDGIGVAGITDRFAATGVAGVALGGRSVGVRGEALTGVGVHGIGSQAGVEGQSQQSDGVRGVTLSGAAAGVSGLAATGTASGVRGQGNGGPGVTALSRAGPGLRARSEQAEGVIAEAKSANAAGVRAKNDHFEGVGIDGWSQAGTALRGTTDTGTGLFVESKSGKAISAASWSSSKPSIQSFAKGGAGLLSTGNPGVLGSSVDAPDPSNPHKGTGVWGFSPVGTAVVGGTMTGVGVLGIGPAQIGAWAGVFQGNVFVDGILMKQASFFSIDHPLDPKRKVLNHAAVESPAHKTFYDGVAVLNRRGEAAVRLPKWFAALNDKNSLCYQLTPIGGPAPNLHIRAPFDGSRFVIAGGLPMQRVCWQLTGIRIDAFARKHPVVVEQSKATARPVAPNPSPRQLEGMGEALKAAHARDKGGAATAKSAFKMFSYPEMRKAERPTERDAASASLISRARKTLATLARLGEASR